MYRPMLRNAKNGSKAVSRAALLFFLFGISILAISGATAQQPAAPHAPGRILVRYAGNADGSPGRSAIRPSSLSNLDARFGLRSSRSLGDARSAANRPRTLRASNPVASVVDSIDVLEFDPAADLDELIAAYSSDPNVLAAEPDFMGSMSGVPCSTVTPSDPGFTNQIPDFDQVGLREAWGTQEGDSNLLVAVIDSGCDEDHEDLVNVLSTVNYDFVDDETDVTDDQAHGTRVCSLIGAEANNARGMAGAAYGVKILALDVVHPDGTLFTAEVIQAVEYAVAQGAEVINMSFTFAGYSSLLNSALQAARGSAVLVAAVGNEGLDSSNRYPAAYDGVIGVAASADGVTDRAEFSNYNSDFITMADIAAPGETLYGAFPGNQYEGVFGNGTSFAAPLVSAVAALVLLQNPGEMPDAVAQHILNTANPIAPGSYTTYGFLNADGAVCSPMLPALEIDDVIIEDSPSIDPSNNNDGFWDVGETVGFRIKIRNNLARATGVKGTLRTQEADISIPDDFGQWPDIDFGECFSPFDDIIVSEDNEIRLGARKLDFALDLLVDQIGFLTVNFTVQAERKVMAPSFIQEPTTFQSHNTYVIFDSLVVGRSACLTIQPGTIIRFFPDQSNYLVVEGCIIADGTNADPILFGSLTQGPGGPDPIHGGIAIQPTAYNVLFDQCRFEYGPVQDDSIVGNYTNLEFWETGGPFSLTINGGASNLSKIKVRENEGGGGIYAPSRDIFSSLAENNESGPGMVGDVFLASTSRNNGLQGFQGTNADGCLAENNFSSGFQLTGGANACTARRNGNYGIHAPAGNVDNSVSEFNLRGILADYVSNSQARFNTTYGIQSGTDILNCRAIGNGARGFIATNIYSSASAHNHDGISIPGTAQGVYAAENPRFGTPVNGIQAGAVLDSTVINHTGGGIVNSVNATNVFVIGNDGNGISSVNSIAGSSVRRNGMDGILGRLSVPYTTVQFSVIRDNSGSGIVGSGPVNNNSMFGNGNYDYLETRPVLTLPLVDIRLNYWGPVTTPLMNANPFGSGFNIPAIFDSFDSGLVSTANYNLHLASAPGAAGANTNTPAFVWSVTPDETASVIAEKTYFNIVFSESMQTLIDPEVTFGPVAPFTEFVIDPDPGWISAIEWQGSFPIEDTTGDGDHVIRISKAVSSDGFLIPDDTAHEFNVDTSGTLVANNGIASVISASVVQVGWQGAGGALGAQTKGFNVARSLTGGGGTYEQVNATPIPNNFFLNYNDGGLAASTQYYWNVYRVDMSDNSVIWSGPVTATTHSGSPTSTPAPSPSANPTSTPTSTPSASPNPSPSASPNPTATPSPIPSATASATAAPCCPGDASNSGGFVDAGDFIAVQANFGAESGYGGPGDADCSGGFVDATDFIAVQANFGADCS